MARYCLIADQVRVPRTMHVEFALVNSDLAAYGITPSPPSPPTVRRIERQMNRQDKVVGLSA
jgi:hypothetical protein